MKYTKHKVKNDDTSWDTWQILKFERIEKCGTLLWAKHFPMSLKHISNYCNYFRECDECLRRRKDKIADVLRYAQTFGELYYTIGNTQTARKLKNRFRGTVGLYPISDDNIVIIVFQPQGTELIESYIGIQLTSLLSLDNIEQQWDNFLSQIALTPEHRRITGFFTGGFDKFAAKTRAYRNEATPLPDSILIQADVGLVISSASKDQHHTATQQMTYPQYCPSDAGEINALIRHNAEQYKSLLESQGVKNVRIEYCSEIIALKSNLFNPSIRFNPTTNVTDDFTSLSNDFIGFPAETPDYEQIITELGF